jgi:hypothetical protein
MGDFLVPDFPDDTGGAVNPVSRSFDGPALWFVLKRITFYPCIS